MDATLMIPPIRCTCPQCHRDLHDCPAATELATVTSERDAAVAALRECRSKCTRQRIERRRLNKTLRSMWDGVRFSHKVRRDMDAKSTLAK